MVQLTLSNWEKGWKDLSRNHLSRRFKPKTNIARISLFFLFQTKQDLLLILKDSALLLKCPFGLHIEAIQILYKSH